ncbi:MAG: glycosyltransferase [bacterium]
MIDSWFAIVSAILLCTYALQVFVFCLGLIRGQEAKKTAHDFEPQITIIVPARNEEANLPDLITSLKNLDYPREKTEIIIVDDSSSDNTHIVATEMTAADVRFRIITPSKRDPQLNGKANAIDFAIQQTAGEIIFITDADCRVPETWIRAHLCYYQVGIGMVGGLVLLTEKKRKYSLFAHLQSLDWLYLCAVGSGGAGVGMPLSIFGNNFSFRKQAYHQVGGFRGAGFSVIEDFALMRAFQLKTRWQIALPADPNLAIQTRPAHSSSQFYLQRKRWVLGGKNVSIAGLFVLTLGFFGRALPIISLMFSDVTMALFSFGWIALSDLLLAGFAAKKIQRLGQMRSAPLYSIFSLGYTLLFAPIFFLSKSVRWKDRVYRVK